MVALSLKISIGNVVKTMQFEPSTMVYDACRMIRERVPEAQTGQPNDFGLFLSDEDPKKGIWLEAGKALDYYMLRNGDTMEYKKKQRPLKIRMLDGTVKTVMVDDSKTVTDMLMTICARIGITNYDEYSLVREIMEEKKEEVTGTIKKDKTLLRDEKKMEKLKQKLHTDDELNWLDHGRTLREQGIDDNETLLLRRKFFYSDQNVDSRDPVQLNLLYVQARDDILNGSHPVSFDKACEFAGYQCQIQFGPHNEQKHKPGFLELKDFLPKEYIKQKGERKIFMAHKNCGNMTEIEAKVRYVKLARSLKTYGVSFFLVKEKMKGKNKLVPRLLGITKECVMRVDEKTKEVIQEWNLTNIKRWAASPKSFTLDFGDYQDGYYSVQTTEGEQIAQLIAGYIDIILKKKKSKDHFGLEGDEESTMLEDSVSPKKSTVLQQQFNRVGKAELGSVALPAIMRTGAGGPENFQVGTMPQPQLQITSGQMHRGHMPPLTSAQQALTGTINSSMQAVHAAQATLDDFETLPPLGQDAASKAWRKNKMDESKHEIHSQVDAITAGTASVVNLTAGDPADTDYTAVGCAVTTISSNLTEMSKGVKLLAALMEDEGGNGRQLLQAAKNLASAVSDLLKTAQPASAEPRQNLLQAAGLVGQTSGELLQQIGESDTDPRFQDMLMQLAKAVASAAAALVLKAKNVAQKTEDSALQTQVIAAATQCALSTSQLVACTKVVAPTISSPVCQEQLIEAGKLVAKSAEGCVEASKAATNDDQLLKQVGVAATAVTQALNDLLQHIKQHALGGQPIGRYDQATDTILNVTENIFSSMGDAGEMVRQARILAQATSDLVNAIKADAEGETDLENSRKLLSAAKILADATAKMVEAAKGAAAHPDSEEQQQRLREAAEGLRMATNAAAQNAIKKKLVHKLEHAAKQAAASATQTIAAAQHAASSNKNPGTALRSLSQAARGVAASTPDPQAQSAMLDCASDVMDKANNLIEEARKAVAKPGDPESQQRLAQVAKAVSQALSRCVNCLPGQRDVDAAIRMVGEASKRLLADSFPPSTKSFQEAQSQLNRAAAGLNQSANELVQASRGTPQDLAKSSGKFGQDFNEFLQAGVEMASQSPNKEDQAQVVSNLKSISMSSSKLLLAAKALSADPTAPNLKNQLAAAARAVTDSINQLITMCTQQAPGQKECDNALRELETVKELLENPTQTVNDMSYFNCLDSVMENSKVLGESMAGISQNAKNSKLPEFGDSISAASKALCGLTEAAAQAAYLVGVSDPNSQAGQQGLVDPTQFARANQAIQMACQNLVDPACTQSQVLSAATIVAKHTSALCNTCRVASSRTANPVAKRQFVQSAKEVANSTANLVKTIKALDGEFNEENRERCRAATAPLIEAVDNLTAFASNPEFATVPAQISPEGRRAMEPIVSSAKTMLESSAGLIQTARSLAVNPKDPPQWSVLAGHSRTVSDSIKKLITNMRDKAPGQRECDEAIEVLNRCMREVDQASLAAISQQLAPREDISQEALHNQMITAVQEISNLIEPVASAARAEASQLGHKVSQMAQYFEPLIMAAIGAASKTPNHQQQMNLLDQTKTLAESALQMLYTAKEAGGNPKQAAHTQEALEEAVQMMKEAVEDLTTTLNEAASAAGVVGGMVDSITQAINQLDEGPMGEPEGTFVDYQTTMVKTAKAIAVTVQEMVTKSTTNPDELGILANQLTNDYGQLAQEAKPAALTAENEEIGSHIKRRVQELGHGCAALVTKAGALQCSPSDAYTKKELIESARKVSEKVSHVLAALQAGNRGTQACITAASAVSGIIADLDTTIMFATAGTLNRENSETFADHREGILKTAKALVEDTKVLVQNATASQEKLAQAAQSSVSTITRLAEVVKLGAASLGSEDPETQVVLINAVKDVAKALGDLIGATKAAAGKAGDDPAVYQLKNSAKVMVTNVTSLLKTVKAVEDEATKGTRALEATIEHIRQELAVFSSPVPPAKVSTPEDFIRMTKGITMATAKAVAAGNSCRQEDVIATANLSRRAIADMLRACKEAAYHPEVSGDVRQRALRFGKECADGYLELLEHVLVILQKPTHELKQQLAGYSKRVASSVTELIQAAEAMKGTEWVDPEDPTVIAENELLGAAAAIEAAAKKLEQLKPRAKPKQADESLNFEEQILEAAKSIAAATSALVKAASAAQRELVAQGKVGAIPANAVDDGQWSQGLISAARMVAAATNNLCEAANAAVQGHASEEKLISSAKQVAASTAQLLVACKVKADHDSEAMKRLQAAGNAVKRASDNLVKAAQKAAAFQDHDETVVVKEKMVGGIAQIIAAQEEMLRKERELEEARKKLAMIRQQQYKFLPSELRDEEQN
ncbi:talin-1 isoform x2 [Limosa lapponica baueri]|uniref:Talin-1 isoform x2 n=1 Tax=Limosa lapponica baueri TaxID=1758121 RepID=A0A2I0U9T2_LIMLA|nr:talin-1 isoform x2 [Limosa lapponica baueri]